MSDISTTDQKKRLLKEPICSIDLSQTTTVGGLVDCFKRTSIQARAIGEVSDVFEAMLQDAERPTIILGLAGPLIAAGLRKIIRDIIEFGLVDCVVSTGAILYQDYYQSKGYQHFRGNTEPDDANLRKLLIDRIYDTYVDEEKFSFLDGEIGRFSDSLTPGEYSSRSFLTAFSEGITDSESILATCYKRGIPIFSPALNDSSIGIGLTEHYHRARLKKGSGIVINSIRDNYELTQIVVKSRCTAAFYVAGGVPKNFINDSIVMAYIFDCDTGGHKYAAQLTSDPAHWGGLSGSTLKEAVSWGKIKNIRCTAGAVIDPSVSLPLVMGHALEKKLYLGRTRPNYVWNDDELKSIQFEER
jgi:deoxyhypusine synthase